ncbi:immunity 53 family protein [Peribacillus butanolivorans]|uniref:immunity 53 family protein n=1 Tax=Peribacillus butanolivorans TaxID=421767 RepID=UPI0036CB4A78
MNGLKWVQDWYIKQCNGDWEHSYGIRIESLDNPGCALQISLDTNLENCPFSRIEIEREKDNWINCWVQDNEFLAVGGSNNLEEIVTVFKEWAEKQ